MDRRTKKCYTIKFIEAIIASFSEINTESPNRIPLFRESKVIYSINYHIYQAQKLIALLNMPH